MPLDSRAFVSRPFEDELFSTVTADGWVVLLGPRQHGKTSALARLYRRLADNGFGCAFLDLQAYGADISYGHFLQWLCQSVARDIGGTPISRDDFESLEDALNETVPEMPASIVLLLDEISALPESWRRRFFGQLRAMFNARTRADEGALSKRLTCVFAGTFRPEEMIEGDNSPFNVSQYIYTTDFTRPNLDDLVVAVDRTDLEPFLPQVFDAAKGQPYLSQLLLSYAERAQDLDQTGNPIEDALRRVKSGDDRHLSNLARRIKGDEAVRRLLPGILAGEIRFNGTDDDQLFAKVLGLAREDQGYLKASNPLYLEAFKGVAHNDVPQAAAPVTTTDVLIITANDIETNSVREVFSSGGDQFTVGQNTYIDLGTHAGRHVVTVRCPDIGSSGSAGSALVTAEAIRDLSPNVVIVAGVAFGFAADKQEIGTILVPDVVVAYETKRIGTRETGAEEQIDRSAHYNLDPAIHGRLREIADGQTEEVQFGIVMSGEKLVDNVAFRDSLREMEPEAKGGEMEAAGVCAAAERARIPWVVIKAICDFADGNKHKEKRFNQKVAGDNSAEFVRLALESGAFDSA